jgi:hypothetical protein
MAVVTKYENGKKIYRSLSGPGISEAEKTKADELDSLLKQKITDFVKKLERKKSTPQKEKRKSVDVYWQLGKILQEILDTPGLVKPAEKPLFWKNVQIHVPDSFVKKDRSQRRIHLEYCYWLARVPKEIAERMSWSEWGYLFDARSVNRKKFRHWFYKKMKQEPEELNRRSIRLFIQCLNNTLGKIETSDLTDEELNRCYEAAWELRRRLLSLSNELNFSQLKQLNAKIREGIKKNYTKIGEVMVNKITADSFAEAVLEHILVAFKRNNV